MTRVKARPARFAANPVPMASMDDGDETESDSEDTKKRRDVAYKKKLSSNIRQLKKKETKARQVAAIAAKAKRAKKPGLKEKFLALTDDQVNALPSHERKVANIWRLEAKTPGAGKSLEKAYAFQDKMARKVARRNAKKEAMDGKVVQHRIRSSKKSNYVSLKLAISYAQSSRLAKGMRIRIRADQINHGNEFWVTQQQYTRLKNACNKGRGATLQLSATQLKHHHRIGHGIFGDIWKRVRKVGDHVIGAVKNHGATLARAGLAEARRQALPIGRDLLHNIASGESPQVALRQAVAQTKAAARDAVPGVRKRLVEAAKDVIVDVGKKALTGGSFRATGGSFRALGTRC